VDFDRRAIELHLSIETAMMETVLAFGAAIPAFRTRVEEQIASRRKEGVPLGDFNAAVLDLDFHALGMAIGALLKDAREGGPLERAVASLLETRAVDRKRLNESLEAIRGERPSWAHGGHQPPTDDELLAAARRLVDLAGGLEAAGFASLVPRLVVIVGRTQDHWGRHLRVIDEQGQEIVAYRADAERDGLLSAFYLLTSTNPAPVRPVLVPRMKMRGAAGG